MARAAAYWELARPLNAALAGVAVAVGALATGARLDPFSVLAAASAAVLGVAGGNAVNDANDILVDRAAHPRRAIPRGLVTGGDALWFGATALMGAVLVAGLANTWCLLLSVLLAGNLLAYEGRFKHRGLAGHALVGYNAGALFLLGGLSALSGPGDHSVATAAIALDARLLAPLSMAVLAGVLNFARELYKSHEDAVADAGHRRTLAVGHPDATRRLADVVTWSVIPLSMVPFVLGWFTATYVYALVPLIPLLVIIPFRRDASSARRLLKVAMVLGLAPFLAIAFGV